MLKTSRRAIALLLGSLMIACGASAQSVRMSPLLSTQECRDLELVGDRLYGATAAGGLVLWDPAAPSTFDSWTTMDGLTSNRLTDLAWTGSHLWVASDGGGLTRITLSPTGPVFRQFAAAGALEVAAVTGAVFGSTERVYFGLVDGGIGVINNGFAGQTFTSNGFPELVSDQITALAFAGEDLWIGTADGISALQQNLFHNRSTGLGNRQVRALLTDDVLGIFAATGDGVMTWDADAASWSLLGDVGGAVADLILFQDELWALREGTGTTDRLARWSGTTWAPEDLPLGNVAVLGATDRLWIAGRLAGPDGNIEAGRTAWAVRDDVDDWRDWSSDDLFFNAVDGCEIADDGTVWLGSRFAAGWSGWDGDHWTQFTDLASAADDSLGLLNFSSGILSMERGADGALWITQFQGGGIIRYRPGMGDCDHITPDNSALSGHRIVRVFAHPDGPIIFMSDQQGVDVLIDPDRWRNPDSWITLPQDANGLSGVAVRDAAMTARDRIWFTTDDAGLVLWDPNGSAGSDAPLTFADQSDDFWTDAQDRPTGTTFDFKGTKGLADGRDGSLWAAGGGGVVHLRLENHGDGWMILDILGTYREMIDPASPGLLRGTLTDIDVDRNGDAWVSHDAGLNRIRLRGTDTYIDAYTNAGAYAAFGLGSLVSAGAITGIPEGTMREVAVSGDGSRLVVGGDFGAAVLEIAPGSGEDTGPLDAVYVHPNPFIPTEHASGLKLSGFESTVTVSQFEVLGGASVEIYNIEGQLVRRRDHVAPDEAMWDGTNQDGAPVASGTYLLRMELRGHVILKSLAVVR